MRRIFTFFLTFLLGMFVTALYAQTHTVSGTVIDKDANEPLIGANVLIKGTTIGTVTDLDGKYTLQAGDKDILVFSYLSMKTIEEPVNGRTVINVKMTSDTETLGEVVVTAMGIKRQSETLTYSAQTVGGKDVNDIKSVNMINSLQGKSAGMMITPNSTGAGGSSKILFRGNKSISGNNQPLVVVDGVPVMMNITNSQVDSNYGGQRDGGDAMSTINPDDIAQITLLKGASAAALYGAVAANGAIMITTKSAQSGKVSVNVSSNTTMESPMVLPEFQTTYGMSDNGTFSWGEKLSSKAPNYAKKFFRTGFTTNNSISLSGGNENIQSYFSYANVYSQGITPQNDYRSHNLNSKVGFNILKDIHIDFTAKFTNQHITNQAAAGYLWNPLTGVYLFPRGEDWNGYKENFEVYDPARGCYVQNWTNTQQQQFGNPYWMLNRQTPITDRNRYEFGGSIKWDITPDLNIQGRMRYERGEEHWVHNAYASSVGNLYPMGRMKDNRYFSDQLYGDVLVSYNHTFNDFSLSATAGSSFTKTKTSHVDLWGEGSQFSQPGSGNIFYPNIFTPNNYYGNMSTVGKDDNWMTQKRLNSVFATAQLGYREGIFLDISARNDWSSALAFTESCSFFYPSFGGSVLLNKFVDMGKNPTTDGSGAVSYMTHVQSYGNQKWVSDGSISGTSGEGKRLEAVSIKVNNAQLNNISGGIAYATHVQTYGWSQGWKYNGQPSGTSGEAKRLEAIRIQLTGQLAQYYDVYYRVHAQTYGWLGWAKNGSIAGTSGLAKRLEAIQIVIIPKDAMGENAPNPLPAAPGTAAYVH